MADVYFDAKHPKARKAHTCSQCARRIEPGETYRRQNYVFDGYAGTVAHCDQCAWLSEKLFGAGFESDEGGWPFLFELETGEVAYCGFGVEFGLFHRKWQMSDGTLFTIPEPDDAGREETR